MKNNVASRTLSRRPLISLMIPALCALGLLFAAPSASAKVSITYTQGTPDTMHVAIDTDNEDFQITNPNNSADYVFDTSCFGCTNNTVNIDPVTVPAGMCSPLVSQTVTCDEAQTGDVPYRVVVSNDATHTMDFRINEGPGGNGARFPTLFTVNANAATTATNNAGADLNFNGGPAADRYGMGRGVELVHGNGGVDTVDYLSYFTGGANVTLDGVPNDTVSSDGNTDNVFNDVENVFGGPGADTITGDVDDNELRGGPGLDTLDGGDGNNILRAEAGGAVMNARGGQDVFDGDPTGGGDVIAYANRTAFVQVSTNNTADDGVFPEFDNLDGEITRIVGGNGGNLMVATGGGGIEMVGGTNPDVFIGSSFSDVIIGGAGNDQIDAAGGGDVVKPGPGTDTYDGGTGVNSLNYNDAVEDMNLSINDGTNDGEGGLELINSNFDNVLAGTGDDTLVGDGTANVLNGNAGADSLDAKGGIDQVDGEIPGANPADGDCDRVRGGGGDDTFNLAPDPGCNTTLDYSDHAGPVTLVLSTLFSVQNVAAGETDTFSHLDNVDVVGTGVADTFTVTTANGAHTLTGGLGNDTLTGKPGGSDTAAYADRAVPVTADLDGINDDGQAAEADILSNIDNLTGGSAGDTLTGDGNANVLDGLGGNDSLTGNPGSDTLRLGAGDDSFAAQDGFADTINCSGGGADSGTFDASPADAFVACADADGDGLPDFIDACPTQVGPGNGCPVPLAAPPAPPAPPAGQKCPKGKKLNKVKGKRKCVKKKRRKK